jgi:phosphopantetheine adenylyltransferase
MLRRIINLFKGKTELEKLHEQHAMLLDKAFKASTVNRTLSDELMAQAYEVEQKILEQARDKRD